MLPWPAPAPDLVARARAFAASGQVAVRARPAATVLLLRDAEPGVAGASAGIEVFMLRRVKAMAFGPGMSVFPGGGVDDCDYAGAPLPGRLLTGLADRLGAEPALAGALIRAAVRETFEETGVLLAAGAPGQGSEGDRQALLARSVTLGDVLARRGLRLDADLLAPWSHWVTPEFEPRRYDVWFFAARLPAGQRARDVGGEADAAGWARPDDVLAAAGRVEVALMPPTEMTLRALLVHRDVASVLSAAAGRRVARWLPTIVSDAGGRAHFELAPDRRP